MFTLRTFTPRSNSVKSLGFYPPVIRTHSGFFYSLSTVKDLHHFSFIVIGSRGLNEILFSHVKKQMIQGNKITEACAQEPCSLAIV